VVLSKITSWLAHNSVIDDLDAVVNLYIHQHGTDGLIPRDWVFNPPSRDINPSPPHWFADVAGSTIPSRAAKASSHSSGEVPAWWGDTKVLEWEGVNDCAMLGQAIGRPGMVAKQLLSIGCGGLLYQSSKTRKRGSWTPCLCPRPNRKRVATTNARLKQLQRSCPSPGYAASSQKTSSPENCNHPQGRVVGKSTIRRGPQLHSCRELQTIWQTRRRRQRADRYWS
jgi:hypothetical protein